MTVCPFWCVGSPEAGQKWDAEISAGVEGSAAGAKCYLCLGSVLAAGAYVGDQQPDDLPRR